MDNAQDTQQTTDRITVALLPEAAGALARLAKRTVRSKTDLVNRAITLYDLIDEEMSAGGRVLICRQDGTTEGVRFL